MNFGYVYPGGDALMAAEHARAAEKAGWDGFFVWDPVWGVDAWVTLTAVALRTKRIRFGTMITPISRRRPWKLASETSTLDRLSNGRLILAVGLGAIETGFTQFGEETDRKKRAELMDEGLDILTGLWKGQPFTHEGQHYHVQECNFNPPPGIVQQPRIPIWVVGAWPRPKSMQRVARYDGLLPNKMTPEGTHDQSPITPDDLIEMRTWIDAHRSETTPFDIIVEGQTPGNASRKAAAKVRPLAEAGATWWLEADWTLTETMWQPKTQAKIRKRIEQGPPQIG